MLGHRRMNQLSETEILLDVAVLGERVDQFLKSDIGRYLLDQAEAEEQAGLQHLRVVNCNNPEEVRMAQNRVWRGETMKAWLKDAVSAGLKARMILEDRE